MTGLAPPSWRPVRETETLRGLFRDAASGQLPFPLAASFFVRCALVSLLIGIRSSGGLHLRGMGLYLRDLQFRQGAFSMTTSLADILDGFEFLDDWEDRYKYVIDLGRALPPFPAECRTDAYKVRGCVSQVWLVTDVSRTAAGEPVLTYQGDSDALIVQGLVAIVLAIFSGKTAQEILATDVDALFARIGLQDHLTPQRSNGLKSMVERIRSDAATALAA